MLNLPPELMWEILLRVPAEHLVELKTICKSWFRLLSSRQFARAHLAYHQRRCEEQDMVIEIRRNSPFLHEYRGINLGHIRDMELKKLNYFRKVREFFNNGVLLITSCDGLLLLQSKHDANQLYVCNPITCRSQALPCLTPASSMSYWILVREDYVESRYKVVGISGTHQRCFVLKLGRDSEWQVFSTPYQDHNYLLSERPPALVNKEFHWLTFSQQCKHYTTFIYSMNAAEEEIRFRVTQVPPLITLKFNCNSILELKGTLCLTDCISSCGKLDIWSLLDQDSSNCQWMKTYTIDVGPDLSNSTQVYSFVYSKQITLILLHRNQLCFYDLENKDRRRITASTSIFSTQGCFVHTNSLVDWDWKQ